MTNIITQQEPIKHQNGFLVQLLKGGTLIIDAINL